MLPGPVIPGSSARPVSVQIKQPLKSDKINWQVNLEKFKEMRTDILENTSLCWVYTVDTRILNIVNHLDSKLLCRYGLSDPLIFINLFNNNKVHFLKFLYLWLAIHADGLHTLPFSDNCRMGLGMCQTLCADRCILQSTVFNACLSDTISTPNEIYYLIKEDKNEKQARDKCPSR